MAEEQCFPSRILGLFLRGSEGLLPLEKFGKVEKIDKSWQAQRNCPRGTSERSSFLDIPSAVWSSGHLAAGTDLGHCRAGAASPWRNTFSLQNRNHPIVEGKHRSDLNSLRSRRLSRLHLGLSKLHSISLLISFFIFKEFQTAIL